MIQLLTNVEIQKKYFAILALFLSQSLVWSQDKKVDVNLNLNNGETQWYAEPWMWVVGGAIFIIIIVAILSGRSKE